MPLFFFTFTFVQTIIINTLLFYFNFFFNVLALVNKVEKVDECCEIVYYNKEKGKKTETTLVLLLLLFSKLIDV
jgi:hypothetical protein